MSKYSLLLSDLIDKSGLSLKEITERSERYGQKITDSYLSKLKNGKMPAPSFKMSIALARSLDVDPELLLSAGIQDNTETNYDELRKTLQELYPDKDEEEVEETTTKIIYTEEERELMLERDLSPEVLKEKYNLVVDGKPASDEEIEEMIMQIRLYRIRKQMEGS